LSFSKIGLKGRSAPSIEEKLRAGSPRPGGSIFTTSAPQSASTPPAAGPATQTPISTTLIPCIGPAMGPPESAAPADQPVRALIMRM
jgi:hypothetical protein